MTLIVSIGKKEPVVMGEMTGDVEVGMIAEMVTDASKLDQFGPGWSASGATLASDAGDDSPEFVIVRVEEGWSRSRRLWTGEQIDNIVAQTNALQPVGHLGHIKDEDAATAFPEPQTTWFGAVTKTEPSKQKERLGEMVKTAYFAGYNLPGAKVRTYIKTKAVRGISWWGNGDMVPVPGKGVEVRNFSLKALDWARKLAEGMPTSSVIATVKEMEDSMSDKALSQVTPEEFKKENPNGYALLVAEATADANAKIAEMETAAEAVKPKLTLLEKACQLLGIDKPEDIITKIEEVQSKVGERAKATVTASLDAILLEKIPGDTDDAKAKRALVARLLPVGEMQAPVIRRREEFRNKGGDLNGSGVTRERVKL